MEQLDTRALSRMVLAPDWSVATASTVDPAQIDQAIVDLLAPSSLRTEEPRLDGPLSKQVESNLRPLGAKISAGISDAAARDWRNAMLLALSDLPGRVAAYATGKAIHRPFNFLNEVETAVREIAAESLERQRTAAWRLKLWREEIARAAMPQPQLAAPDEVIADQAGVDAFNADMAKIGTSIRMRLGPDGKGLTYSMDADEREKERQKSAGVDSAAEKGA